MAEKIEKVEKLRKRILKKIKENDLFDGFNFCELKVEEVEHKSFPGFIPFTSGGAEASITLNLKELYNIKEKIPKEALEQLKESLDFTEWGTETAEELFSYLKRRYGANSLVWEFTKENKTYDIYSFLEKVEKEAKYYESQAKIFKIDGPEVAMGNLTNVILENLEGNTEIQHMFKIQCFLYNQEFESEFTADTMEKYKYKIYLAAEWNWEFPYFRSSISWLKTPTCVFFVGGESYFNTLKEFEAAYNQLMEFLKIKLNKQEGK